MRTYADEELGKAAGRIWAEGRAKATKPSLVGIGRQFGGRVSLTHYAGSISAAGCAASSSRSIRPRLPSRTSR